MYLIAILLLASVKLHETVTTDLEYLNSQYQSLLEHLLSFINDYMRRKVMKSSVALNAKSFTFSWMSSHIWVSCTEILFFLVLRQ